MWWPKVGGWSGRVVAVAAAAAVACGGRLGSDEAEPGSSAVGGQTTVAASGGGLAMTGSWASGGTSGVPATGGSLSSGGQPTATGGSAMGGSMPADFCAGGAKVDYHGQLSVVAVTHYQPLDTRSCCWSDGMRLHTRESLGFDLVVIVSQMAGLSPGVYEVPASMLSAGVGTPDESVATVHPATGQLYVTGETPEATPWQIGACLTVGDPPSELDGTRVYVPGVPMDYSGVNDRFGIWLLDDPTLRATDAALVALDSLTLAPTPLLGLTSIEYVEQGSGWVQFTPIWQNAGDSIRTRLGQVDLYGRPFVVVADGVRTHLGAFFPSISSVGIPDPTVNVDLITNDGFTINAPSLGPDPLPDPRNDPRILKVLEETGRLSP